MSDDVPTLPGWVDERLDEIFAEFPEDLPVTPARDTYATCLANAIAAADIAQAAMGCRRELIAKLEEMGLETEVVESLDEVLEALEEEIAEED
jgi:hypothetical protein